MVNVLERRKVSNNVGMNIWNHLFIFNTIAYISIQRAGAWIVTYKISTIEDHAFTLSARATSLPSGARSVHNSAVRETHLFATTYRTAIDPWCIIYACIKQTFITPSFWNDARFGSAFLCFIVYSHFQQGLHFIV